MSKNTTAYLGFDGLLTLLLSTMVIILSMGLSLTVMLYRVYTVATQYFGNKQPFDLIIIHGVKLNKNQVNDDYILRLDKAFSLQPVHHCKILILGGLVGSNTVSESAAGKEYLVKKGISASFILVESESRHTLENLSGAKNVIKSSGFNHCGLLSNRYHLARISALAKGKNINFRLIAAEDTLTFSINNLFKLFLEAIYLHWYYIGKLWSYATSNSHSIDRLR